MRSCTEMGRVSRDPPPRRAGDAGLILCSYLLGEVNYVEEERARRAQAIAPFPKATAVAGIGRVAALDDAGGG